MERIPSLRLLGAEALRVLAIGSEQKEFARGTVLYREGEPADCAYIIQNGTFKLVADGAPMRMATPDDGALLDEMALLVPRNRAATATANEFSSVIRIGRSLFQRVLESDPAAALRLRDDIAARSTAMVEDLLRVKSKLTR